MATDVSVRRCFSYKFSYKLYAKSPTTGDLDISITTCLNSVQRLQNTLLYMVIHILYCKWKLACCGNCRIHLKKSPHEYLYVLPSKYATIPSKIGRASCRERW